MFGLKVMSNMNRAFLDTAQPSLPYPTHIYITLFLRGTAFTRSLKKRRIRLIFDAECEFLQTGDVCKTSLLGPDEVAQIAPHLAKGSILGALHTTNDGCVSASVRRDKPRAIIN